jgi:hypothetical protein
MLILMLRFLAARPMVSGPCTPPTLLLSISANARFIWRFFEAASCHAWNVQHGPLFELCMAPLSLKCMVLGRSCTKAGRTAGL